MTTAAALLAGFAAGLTPVAEEVAAFRAATAEVILLLRRHYHPFLPATARDDHLIAGSIGKRTATTPLPPLDLLYVLPGSAPGTGIPRILAEMAGILGELPPEWSILVEDAALSLRQGPMVVALRPAFEQDGAYLIPLAGRWRLSNPVAETAALRIVEAASQRRARPLLALLRAWRRAAGAPVASFALETMVREFFDDAQAAGDLPELLTDFLIWSRRRTPCRFILPGGAESLEVGDEWHGAAEAAYWRCVLAGRHHATGDEAAARAEWRRLFGPGFAADDGPAFPWNIPADLG